MLAWNGTTSRYVHTRIFIRYLAAERYRGRDFVILESNNNARCLLNVYTKIQIENFLCNISINVSDTLKACNTGSIFILFLIRRLSFHHVRIIPANNFLLDIYVPLFAALNTISLRIIDIKPPNYVHRASPRFIAANHRTVTADRWCGRWCNWKYDRWIFDLRV